MFLLSLVAAAVLVNPAVPYQCVIIDQPEKLYAAADLVFLGTVLSKKPTGTQGFHVTVEIATIRVDQVWKGKPGKQIDVGGDALFDQDVQYLVFAGGTPPSTSLLCRWTEPVDRAKAKLDWLVKQRHQ